jgi:hypothetical protein
VRTFFFARKHVQVRGFVCALDGRPAKRCRSPKAYVAGIGKHVFRVRAIGWSGLKGPPAVARFEVCHPTDRSLCDGRPLGGGSALPRPDGSASARASGRGAAG